jgi:hypothetical protein
VDAAQGKQRLNVIQAHAIAAYALLSKRQQRPVYALVLHTPLWIHSTRLFSYIVGAFDT